MLRAIVYNFCRREYRSITANIPSICVQIALPRALQKIVTCHDLCVGRARRSRNMTMVEGRPAGMFRATLLPDARTFHVLFICHEREG